MVYTCYEIKTGSGASVNKELPQELHKSVIKNFKRKYMQGLEIIFGQQI